MLPFVLVGYSQNPIYAEESQYTPEDYVSYLTGLSESGDKHAAEILSQFNGLEKDKQEAFVKFLFSPGYADAVATAMSIPSKEAKVSTVKVIDNVELPVTMSKAVKIEPSDSSLTSNKVAAASEAYSVTSHDDIQIAGIVTTTLYETFVYETDGRVATKSLSVKQDHNNWNPAYIITPIGTNSPGYVTGGWAFGSAQWTMSMTGSFGGISSTWTVEIKAHDAKEWYYRCSTTKPNGGGHDWI